MLPPNLKVKFNVYVTQVSIDERIAQNCRDVISEFEQVEEFSKKHSSIIDVKMRKTIKDVCDYYRLSTPKAYKKIFGDNIIPYKKNKSMFSEILDRAYMKTPPFPMHEKSDHGFKDTIIWISLKKYFKDNGENEIVFVTNDKGFINNKDKLIEEFEKETNKEIKIVSNSYYDEILKPDNNETTTKVSKPLPDLASLREKIHNTLYELCFVVETDYWGNEIKESIFLTSKKIDLLDVTVFYEELEKILNIHMLEKSIMTEEVFSVISSFSPVIYSIPIEILERNLSLYKEIKEKHSDYINQFYSAAVSMFNLNYVKPAENIESDDELPF